MTVLDAATLFLFRKRTRQLCGPATHAHRMLVGSLLLVAPAPAANAQQAALAGRATTFLQDSLKQWGYFTPRGANLPNIKFYCVCGPYRTCKHEAQDMARALGYQLPPYDYVKGAGRLRQKILFYFEHGQMVEIEIPYRPPFYVATEHEGFCDVNLDKRLPQTFEERYGK